MYRILDLLLNFNTGKKINFEQGILWGLILFFLFLNLVKLIA
jgi:hypothetical protein